MRKFIFSFITFLMISVSAMAEKLTFYTGLATGCTLENPMISYDPYIPLAYIRTGGRCYVTSIKRTEEKDIWCMTLTVESTDSNSKYPISYDYYLKKGESIYLRRVAAKLGSAKLRVVSVDLNKATFEVE